MEESHGRTGLSLESIPDQLGGCIHHPHVHRENITGCVFLSAFLEYCVKYSAKSLPQIILLSFQQSYLTDEETEAQAFRNMLKVA